MAQTSKTKSEAAESNFHFAGFKNLNSTPIPDEFFDVLAVRLSEAELRVLLYIMRRTFGFKKTADAISLSQLTDGIRRRDGSMLDYGTGLSKPAVLKAVNGLQTKGIITVEKRTGYDGRNEVNVYQLRFQQDTPASKPEQSVSQPDVYSQIEYSVKEQTFTPIPDPRFDSARPVPVEQKQAGAYQQKGSKTQRRVKPVNQGGKQALPLPRQDSKENLPGQLKSVDYQGQNQPAGGVKMLNQQHGSLQESRNQETVQQVVWRSAGSLALLQAPAPQPVSPVEELAEVEVEVDGDMLYINFRKLVLALTELGLSEKLANDYAYSYPEEYLWEKIELTRRQVAQSSHQRTIHNVAGYLRRAIDEDYQPRPVRPAPATSTGRHFPQAAAFRQPAPAQDFTTNPPPGDAPLPPTRRLTVSHPAAPGTFSTSGSNGSSARVGQLSYGASSPEGSMVNSVYYYGNAINYNEDYFQPDPVVNQDYPSKANEGAVYAELWEQVCQDLAGRYRLGEALSALSGACLWLNAPPGRSPQAVVRLAAPWQLDRLSLAARSAVTLVLRQQLGPGYQVCFEVG